jgi:hypothetical protein
MTTAERQAAAIWTRNSQWGVACLPSSLAVASTVGCRASTAVRLSRNSSENATWMTQQFLGRAPRHEITESGGWLPRPCPYACYRRHRWLHELFPYPCPSAVQYHPQNLETVGQFPLTLRLSPVETQWHAYRLSHSSQHGLAVVSRAAGVGPLSWRILPAPSEVTRHRGYLLRSPCGDACVPQGRLSVTDPTA